MSILTSPPRLTRHLSDHHAVQGEAEYVERHAPVTASPGWQPIETAEPSDDELDEAWKSGFNAGFGEAKLTQDVTDKMLRDKVAGMRALLLTGCDLLAVEAEGMRGSLCIGSDPDRLSDDPTDAAAVVRITEIEDWIASVKATLYPAAPQPREGRMQNDAKLLPCPFCGGPASFGTVKYSPKHVQEQGWNQDTFHFVSCIKCGVSNCGIVGHDTMVLAAELWNHRELMKAAPVTAPMVTNPRRPASNSSISRDAASRSPSRRCASVEKCRPASVKVMPRAWR